MKYLKYIHAPLWVLAALWLAGMAVPAIADSPMEDTAPANPAQFHEQEWQRILQGIERYQSAELTSTEDDYDALYYHITVDVRDFSTHTIYGNVYIIARSLSPDFDALVLDLCSAMTVDSAVFGGLSRQVTRNDDQMTVELAQVYGADQIVEGTVYYHGTPCTTNLFTPTMIYYNRPVGLTMIPTISTLSEPYGARDWWPSKNVPGDKVDSMRMSIIVADTLTATSNGVLESVTPLAPSSRIFTWFERHPIASYLISLNATNYASFTLWYSALNGDSVPIVNYAYPERLGPAMASWNALPAMMDYCADLFGEFPFVDEKYGQSMFNVSGGMEHQCNTSFGRVVTDGQHTYDYLIMHELTHQWFGDAVTLETWPDIWLNEGFASYGEALWIEHANGETAFHSYMDSPNDNGVVDPSGPIYNPSILFSGNTVYNKGAWILHMLRGVVRNDSLFFATLRAYKQAHFNGVANTQQFLADVSTSLGYDVTPYLYTYLYRTNRPSFVVSMGSGTVDGNLRTVVRISQIQGDPDTTFQTRLDLAFGAPLDSTISITNSQREERYYYNFNAAPASITVDPDDWVLKNLQFTSLPPTILNAGLEGAVATVAYRDTLIAIGGTAPYSWNVARGTLPLGLAMLTNGILVGTPLTVGNFTFTAYVTDSLGAEDSMQFAISVASPVSAPQGLTIYRISEQSVGLRWQHVALADSYYVCRATQTDLSDATVIAITSGTKATDLIATEDPGTGVERFYYVVAVRRTPQ